MLLHGMGAILLLQCTGAVLLECVGALRWFLSLHCDLSTCALRWPDRHLLCVQVRWQCSGCCLVFASEHCVLVWQQYSVCCC